MIKAKWLKQHTDGVDDYHELVYLSPWKANKYGRTNSAMYIPNWQLWICNNPECRGRVIINNQAIVELVNDAQA